MSDDDDEEDVPLEDLTEDIDADEEAEPEDDDADDEEVDAEPNDVEAEEEDDSGEDGPIEEVEPEEPGLDTDLEEGIPLGGDPDEDAPLGDLAREYEQEEPTDEDDPFMDMSVEEAEEEVDWEALLEGEIEPEPPGQAEPGAAEQIAPEEHVVDKRKFCQRCNYFSEPPEVSCSHEGTEIVEVVDSDHFRVRNCPIVQEAEFGPSPE